MQSTESNQERWEWAPGDKGKWEADVVTEPILPPTPNVLTTKSRTQDDT